MNFTEVLLSQKLVSDQNVDSSNLVFWENYQIIRIRYDPEKAGVSAEAHTYTTEPIILTGLIKEITNLIDGPR